MRPLQPLPRPSLPVQSLNRALRPRRGHRTAFSTRPNRPPSPPNPRNNRHLPPRARNHQTYTTTPPPNPNPNPTTTTTTTAQTQTTKRITRLLARLPTPLQRYTSRLRGAPVTHVAAFLILHELTAVVPLLGLFGLFHYTEHVPVAWMVAHYGGYVREGVGRFERWFARRGWFGFGGEGGNQGVEGGGGQREGVVDGGKGVGLQAEMDGVKDIEGGEAEGVLQRWERDPKYRVVVEIGLAYALTKVLLPVRIVGSVWATPWFAGVLGRLRRVVGRGG